MVLLSDAPKIYLDVLSGICGLVLGSFLNVVAYRVPRGLRFAWERSACPSCGTKLAARDNVPLLSFVILRGHCRYCRSPISARYPFIEALSGSELALLAIRFGPVPRLGLYALLAMIVVAMAALESANASSGKVRHGALVITILTGALWLFWQSPDAFLLTASILTGILLLTALALWLPHFFRRWGPSLRVHLVALLAIAIFLASALSPR